MLFLSDVFLFFILLYLGFSFPINVAYIHYTGGHIDGNILGEKCINYVKIVK